MTRRRVGLAALVAAALTLIWLGFSVRTIASEDLEGAVGLVRPSLPAGEADPATVAEIAQVIQKVLGELNGTGANLDAYYLADNRSVYFGPPAAGPELVRTFEFDDGVVEELIQTGVVRGGEVSATLSACLISFSENGMPVTVSANNDLSVRVAGPIAYATLTGVNAFQASHSATPFRWTLILEEVQVGGTQRWVVVHDHMSFS